MMMIAGAIAITRPGNAYDIVEVLKNHYLVAETDIKNESVSFHNQQKWAAFQADFDRRCNGKSPLEWEHIAGGAIKRCEQFVVYYFWDRRDPMLEKPVVYVEMQDEDAALAFELKFTMLAD